MPIIRLLARSSFDPDTIHVLSKAFDDAWQSLEGSGSVFAADFRAASTRELLAKRIIEMAQRGEKDVARLRDHALAQFLERSSK